MFGTSNAAPPAPKKLANIDADQTSTNQQAIPVAYLSGRRRVNLHYIAPAYNVRTDKVTATTGKDQTSTVGYIYYGDLAGLFCLGGRAKINHLFRLIFDSAIEWEGDIEADADPYEPVTVVNRGLFRIFWGTPTQPVDTLVLTPLATTVPPGVDPRDTTTWPGGDYTNKHP
jgi:hypothetical protein